MILGETKEPVVTEYAKDIRSSGTSLLSLVNEILDFSKIEAAKMELLPVEYDLDKLFNDLLNIIGLRAQEKGLTLKIQADPSLPRILYGDEVRLKQIISNLLTNGVKYTDKGYVSLIVDYKQIDDYQIELIVKVEDTGKGIRPEDMEKLFTPFERLEEMSNRHVEGTGLGIALTRTFLQMMGSNLEVESIYGYGSTFSFRIRQEVESWDPIGSLDEAIKRAKSEIESAKEFFVAPLARVLVVDDIPVNLKVIAALLKRTRIEIDTAGSGMEALTLMRKNKYDMIFMDHMMPEMDGIETLERMNADRFDVNRFETPVIALTANAVSGAREMYVKKGFADYMTKPVDSAHLEAIRLKYLKPELIVKVDGSEIDESFEDEYSTESKNIRALRHLPMINVEHGIETSGGAEIYEDVIRDYTMTIDEYSKRIEDYYNAGDINNFRIQVHALKSTSRMAGADEVSELAKELELAANDGNIEYIKKETPVLLARYRDLKGALTEVFGEPGADDTDKPEMDEDTFVDALHAILEGVEIFDYDLIESVMAEIENCRIPDQYKSAYDRMKMLVADVNTDELGECIKTTLRQNGKA
jgi:CheY-like chemotaxis protein